MEELLPSITIISDYKTFTRAYINSRRRRFIRSTPRCSNNSTGHACFVEDVIFSASSIILWSSPVLVAVCSNLLGGSLANFRRPFKRKLRTPVVNAARRSWHGLNVASEIGANFRNPSVTSWSTGVALPQVAITISYVGPARDLLEFQYAGPVLPLNGMI